MKTDVDFSTTASGQSVMWPFRAPRFRLPLRYHLIALVVIALMPAVALGHEGAPSFIVALPLHPGAEEAA